MKDMKVVMFVWLVCLFRWSHFWFNGVVLKSENSRTDVRMRVLCGMVE